jgi:hypothetical protein
VEPASGAPDVTSNPAPASSEVLDVPLRDRARRSRVGPWLPLLCLMLATAPLVFRDLGGPWLWEDEADTASFARAIQRTGLPVAWDGRNFTDSDDGFRVAPHLLGQDLVMVGTPWLPYYVTAASFALLGESEWSARLPFALAGLATVAVLYLFVLDATACVRSALAAALLLVASAQFLLYARECRSYTLNMLLTVLLLWGFLRLGVRRRDPWLAAAAVLLFHVQILPAAIALGACALLALLHPACRSRLAALLRRAPWVALFTLPWMAVTWSAVRTNWAPLADLAEVPVRLVQLGAEASVAIPALGWVLGLPLVWHRLGPRDRTLLRLCGAWLALALVLVPLAMSAALLEVVGLRYVCGLLPVAAAVTGLVVARASGRRRIVYAALLASFAATHLAGNAIPWLALGQSRRIAGALVHVPRETAEKLLNLPWWHFVRGLGVPDPGTLPALVERLHRDNARADDVVLTNFGWDALGYYSNLPQAFRIAPDAPVRRKARALGLPAYVFGIDHPDWLVWRGDNEALLGYAFTLFGLPLDDVRARLVARGARLEQTATLHETLWDNRPELFWHRFPGDPCPFAPRSPDGACPGYSDARIFRVQWPSGKDGPLGNAPSVGRVAPPPD